MSAGMKAVFLSYASQDAEAARRICDALQAVGIEVWFDQTELRGGEVWDRKINEQIHRCRLFIPIISANTEARDEGYFRREWGVAVDRMRDMAEHRAFLVPVVIDGTAERGAAVPERFRQVQWTKLPGGESTPNFINRLATLLGGSEHSSSPNRGSANIPTQKTSKRTGLLGTFAGLAMAMTLGVGWLAWRHLGFHASSPSEALPATGAPAAISEKSVAVLPFLDLSEKKDQEYFSDGLSEELIDLLTKIHDLRVPARTSSFYFKGKQTTIAEIANALGVSHVLEGSVRRSGDALRITAQLIRADSGYHLWSQTYDRKVDDIFKIQDSIASAVVEALKVSLGAGGMGQDRVITNSEAYLLYMKGRYQNALGSEADIRMAIESLKQAVALDPAYAPAWSELADCYENLSAYVDPEPGKHMELAREAVKKAISLNPANASAHYLLATILVSFDHDWPGALAEIEAAQRVDPNMTEPVELVWVQGCNAGPCHDKFIRDIERDPLNANGLASRGYAYYYAGDLEAAERDLHQVFAISPNHIDGAYGLARVLMVRHKFDEAKRILEATPDSLLKRQGLAMLYFYQGNKTLANAALANLLAMDSGDGPFQIAEVYAARGDAQAAIDWLQRDYDKRMYGILDAKVDPLFKGLAHESRYIALMHKFAPSEGF